MKSRKSILRRRRFVPCAELVKLHDEIKAKVGAHIAGCKKCQKAAVERQVSRSLEVVVFGNDPCC